ncbi:hypothetical protein [Caballeronia sp. BR00000012568055]|uniref:hypothetical protein n=1 Tax=Caballeronia sp. BR00000012568055 TaxID=2918761 RepID=UPI0023F727EC|nr:hypothetical protein [Caballeronia sp. BR00000012568055]
MIRRFVLCLLLLCSMLAHADEHTDDTPRTMLRAHLEPSGAVTAGTAITLVVDALTTTWFTAAPDWPLFDMPDAFVTLPDENAQNLNETIDGVHWFGVSRAYRIVPRTAGTFDVPSFKITLHPGGTETPVILDTPALRLTATLPRGAEGMTTFFPAPHVSATQRIDPADGKLEVGGTVTRTITQRADATEAMLIPPLAFTDIDGLRRNDKPPATRNITQDRAGLIAGERVDSVTYVVNRRGHFELPPVRIEWWNTLTHSRETIDLPGVSFTARAAHEKPLWALPADAARHTVIFLNARDVVAVCIALACIVAGVAWYPRIGIWLARLKARLANARKQRKEGERAAWHALSQAADSGIMQRVVPALYRWMDVNPRMKHPARLSDLQDEAEDEDVKRLAKAVEAHYAASSERKDAAPRIRFRRRIGWNRARAAKRPALPPLNEG